MNPSNFFVFVLFALAASTVTSTEPTIPLVDDQLRDLMIQKRELLAERLEFTEQLGNAGVAQAESLFHARRDLLAAELDLTTSNDERIKVLESQLENLQNLEELIASRFASGDSHHDERFQATADRIDAEIALVKARADRDSEKDLSEKGAPPRSHVVHLMQVRCEGLTGRDLAEELKQLRESGKIEVLQSFRLTTIENVESVVSFSKQVAVVVGTTKLGNGAVAKTMDEKQIGTDIVLEIESEEGHLILHLEYENSRLDENGTDESPPDRIESAYRTALVLKPGEPTLVGGTSGEEPTYLLVSIEP